MRLIAVFIVIALFLVAVLVFNRYTSKSAPKEIILETANDSSDERPVLSPYQLTAGKIFFAVLGALWTFSISAGLLYLIARSLLTPGM